MHKLLIICLFLSACECSLNDSGVCYIFRDSPHYLDLNISNAALDKLDQLIESDFVNPEPVRDVLNRDKVKIYVIYKNDKKTPGKYYLASKSIVMHNYSDFLNAENSIVGCYEFHNTLVHEIIHAYMYAKDLPEKRGHDLKWFYIAQKENYFSYEYQIYLLIRDMCGGEFE